MELGELSEPRLGTRPETNLLYKQTNVVSMWIPLLNDFGTAWPCCVCGTSCMVVTEGMDIVFALNTQVYIKINIMIVIECV